jgi:MFS family permease
MARRNPWAMAALTGAGVFTTFILRFNISAVAVLLAQPPLDLSDWQVGLVFSGFLWTYAFLQPVAGFVTDRLGAKLSLLLGVLATSLLTILTGFVGSFLALFSLRVALGATQAPNFVSGAKVSASGWFNEQQRARATSIWISGGRLGPAVTAPLAAWLGVSFGWQWAFFVTGLLGLLWCAIWFVGFQDNPEDTQSKSQTRSKGTLKIRESFPILLSPLGLGFALASFGQGYVAYYLNLWLPTYLVREQKFTILNAGIFASVPLICAVTTLLLVGGFLSDYLVRRGASPLGLRRNMFAIGMVAASITLFATAYAPDPYSALLSLSLAGAALGFSTPSLWVALVEATPKSITGAMGGIQNFGGNLAGIVVAVLTGYILEVTRSFFTALLVGSMVALLGAISAAILIRQRIPNESATGSR